MICVHLRNNDTANLFKYLQSVKWCTYPSICTYLYSAKCDCIFTLSLKNANIIRVANYLGTVQTYP